MMIFAAPYWLLALPLPMLAWLGMNFWKQLVQSHLSGHTSALLHPQAELLAQLAQQLTPHHARVPWLWLAGCSLLIIAMAQPQSIDGQLLAEQRAHNIMLALDVSGSMRAQDFVINHQPVSRIDMLKHIVNDLLEKRQGDRFGLIVFGDDVYTLSPLTRDTRLAQTLLQELEQGMAGEKTAMGDALALAAQRLHAQPGRTHTLILLTDGTQTSGTTTPQQAIQLAKRYDIRIHTIGIGTHNKVLVPQGVVDHPAYTEMPFDEALLARMAKETGGRYFHAARSEDLKEIIKDIDAMETVAVTNGYSGPRREWYGLPLIIGLMLLLAWQFRQHDRVLP